jgi:hypothetical protein
VDSGAASPCSSIQGWQNENYKKKKNIFSGLNKSETVEPNKN